MAQIMRAALRVLKSVTSHTSPNVADLQTILSFAPDLAHLDADEAACQVVDRIRRSMHLPRVGQPE